MGKILDSILRDNTLDKIGKCVDKTTNQPEKIDKLKELLGKCDLKIFDCGTNRVVFKTHEYPKTVFKVALDEQGVLDNLNEYEKSDKSKRFPTSYDIDPNGYILVQRRDKLIEQENFVDEKTQKGIRKMLKELEDEFVLLDLGLDKRKNFGIDENGDYTIIDFGYITYKDFANMNCPLTHTGNNGKLVYCKGTLQYTKNYNMMKCDKCGNIFKVDVILEGHGEHKYATPPKTEEFEVTPDLENFYKKFNKSRDQVLLKEYVKLNSGSNLNMMKGGEECMSSIKDCFLHKAGCDTNITQVAKPDSGCSKSTIKSAAEPSGITRLSYDGQAYPTKETIGGNASVKKPAAINHREIYEIPHDNPVAGSATDKTNMLGDNPANLTELEVAELAKQLIERNLPDGAIGDDIISDIFYKRFPDIRDLVDLHSVKDSGPNFLDGLVVEDYITIKTAKRHSANIIIDLDDKKASGEQPVITIIYHGKMYDLDITQHMPLIEPIQGENDSEDNSEYIISYMYIEPKDTFNGDYEERYSDAEFADEEEASEVADDKESSKE